MTGRTLFYASSQQAIRQELSDGEADQVTIHDTVKGTFATGATVFAVALKGGGQNL
ncbi:hypothetical protein [Rhodohalobacter sp. 614A]|uniref:hypothetical protein n=1 Tax=Rhodohalobacter sp. 614A TaxID=2908649 RepID=UPI001F206D76|nr:hypothetical protein [Rhodohalobacter sp. 614A]